MEAARALRNGVETGILRVTHNGARDDLVKTDAFLIKKKVSSSPAESSFILGSGSELKELVIGSLQDAL